MVSDLKQRGLYKSTAIIVTSKHGQSPTDHSKLAKNGDTLSKLLESSNYFDSGGNIGQANTKSGNAALGSSKRLCVSAEERCSQGPTRRLRRRAKWRHSAHDCQCLAWI